MGMLHVLFVFGLSSAWYLVGILVHHPFWGAPPKRCMRCIRWHGLEARERGQRVRGPSLLHSGCGGWDFEQ